MSAVWAELARPRSMGRVPPLGAGLSMWLARWREGFFRWREWRRSRQMLLTLGDRELRDIGLTRLDACGVEEAVLAAVGAGLGSTRCRRRGKAPGRAGDGARRWSAPR